MANPDADRELGIAMEADSDSDEDPAVPRQDEPRQGRLERFALFDFLRLVAGNREPQPGFRTIEELVNHLRGNDTITSNAVLRAMLACPRDLFVPHPHQGEALVDRPIRVGAAGFNISAPHVQAVALQALSLEPGQRVLDVGCGCGVVTAYAAYLTGSSGEVVGIDVRDSAIKLSTLNLRRLKAQNIEFSEVAAPIHLERHNVFIPVKRHLGRYDAVHVGGAMQANRLGALLALLGPKGGRIVAPIASELRLVVKSPEGTVRQQVLSQVAFSELEVPRDVDVVQALLQEQVEADRRVDVPPSTFASDLAHLAAPGADLRAVAASAADTAALAAGLSTSPTTTPRTSISLPAPESPRHGTSGGVRPRSETSLSDEHIAPATLPPAHRGSGREIHWPRRLAAADGTDGPTGPVAAAAPPPLPPSAGGWGWKWERPPPSPAKANSAESDRAEELVVEAGMDMDIEAGEKVPLLPGLSGLAAATAAAPAGPIEAGAAETETAMAEPSPPPPQDREGSGDINGCRDSSGKGLSYLTGIAEALALGETDCELEGDGWRLPAHKAVLQARCELLRAHMGSGMRDSDAGTYRVPEAVERQNAVEAFLHYVYKDYPPPDLDMELVPQLLHAGIYFGCHRLVRLCESLLARELVAASSQEGQAGADPEVLEAAVAAAGPLLALADEGGLDQLRRVAMQFVLDHFPAVTSTEGYRQLPRPLVDEVVKEALNRYNSLLKQLARLGESGRERTEQDGDDDLWV